METLGAVAFSSLLIGLMAGPQPVSVDVAASAHAASVVFMLDGTPVERLTAPPWRTVLDFGPELQPHEVVAVATDSEGHEVGRASRPVNVAQESARLDIVVDRDRLGRPVSAELIATSVVRERPVRESLALDGRSLSLMRHRAALPTLNLEQAHVLSGVAEFAENSIARADVAFGGGVADSAGARLMTVPIMVTGGRPPSVESLHGLFRRHGEILTPVLVEKGISTILFVRNPSSLEADRVLARPAPGYAMKFDPADRLAFVWPIAAVVPDGSSQVSLLESTPYFSGKDGSFFWLLTRVSRPGHAEPPFRYLDAVAVAGMDAAASGTRRAVILVEGDEHRDSSRFSAAQVSGYLRRLGVPLRVWHLGGPGVADWAAAHVDVEDISSVVRLQRSISRLKEDLDRQRVVWLRGEWAAPEIELAPTASGFKLLE